MAVNFNGDADYLNLGDFTNYAIADSCTFYAAFRNTATDYAHVFVIAAQTLGGASYDEELRNPAKLKKSRLTVHLM